MGSLSVLRSYSQMIVAKSSDIHEPIFANIVKAFQGRSRLNVEHLAT